MLFDQRDEQFGKEYTLSPLLFVTVTAVTLPANNIINNNNSNRNNNTVDMICSSRSRSMNKCNDGSVCSMN